MLGSSTSAIRKMVGLLGLLIALSVHEGARAQSGAISSPNSPCNLASGQTTCTVDINWSMSGASVACVWKTSPAPLQLWACTGGGGSGSWPWTLQEGVSFGLTAHNEMPTDDQVGYNSGTWLGSLTVYAVPPPPPPTGSLSASGNPCTLNPGATTCDVQVQWTTSGVNACIWMSNGQPFACGGPSGSVTFPHAWTGGNEMILRQYVNFSSSDPELARLYVYAVPPNSPPSATLTSPASNGFVGHTGTAIYLSASASDSDGYVTRVDYFENGSFIGSGYAPNFTIAWVPNTSGIKQVSARAEDNAGASSGWASADVIVAEHGVPPLSDTHGNFGQYTGYVEGLSNARRSEWGTPGQQSGYFTTIFPMSSQTWRAHFHNPSESPTPSPQDEYEDFELKHNCQGGTSWLYANAYKSAGSNQIVRTLYPTLALIEYQGRIWDITNVCGGGGHAFAPWGVPAGAYTMRVWHRQNTTNFGYLYWQIVREHRPSEYNACWRGAGSNTRPVIWQQEAWSAYISGNSFGYTIGSGEMTTVTELGVLDGQSYTFLKPTGLNVVYGRQISAGYNATTPWTMFHNVNDPSSHACLLDFQTVTYPMP
jgi:hypothetical protein